MTIKKAAFIELKQDSQPPWIHVIQTTTNGIASTQSHLYGGLNLGLHVGDDAVQVHKNRAELLYNLQQSYENIERISWLNQVHGNEIYHVTEHLATDVVNADAQLTTLKGIGLAIMTADCVPVMIASTCTADSPNDCVIAAVHAGWQGIAKNIVYKTIQKMAHQVNIDEQSLTINELKKVTHNWQAWIGASIAQTNYEVDSKVKNAVIAELKLSDAQTNEVFLPNDKREGHFFADLPKIAELQLKSCGINNVYQSQLDSYLDERFYSYRQQTQRQQSATGRMATIIFKT